MTVNAEKFKEEVDRLHLHIEKMEKRFMLHMKKLDDRVKKIEHKVIK